jgi:hypothetical protein
LAHIYIGTLGMEGAFEAMGSGGSQLGEGGSRSLACPTTRNADRQGQPSAAPAE